MKLIKPKQISGEIMTLFEEAEEKVIIISPYYKISKWYKLLNCFDDLKRRDIQVETYVRENEHDSIAELNAIGFNPVSIPNLHTKLYLNEKYSIVSSMNILLSSDTNSLDIALKTESIEEYKELYEYYKRYIKNCSGLQKQHKSQNDHYNWIDDLDKRIQIALCRKIHIYKEDGKIRLNNPGKYEVFIHTGKTNDLRISGVLSFIEFEFISRNIHLLKEPKIKFELTPHNKKYLDTIWGTLPNMNSRSINELKPVDEKLVVNAIVDFIVGIEQLKSKAAGL